MKSALRRRITPSVPFTLRVEDGKDIFEQSFRLSFDLNAFVLFEDTVGVNLLQNLSSIFDSPSVTTLTALFWVAIQENHPEYAGEDGLQILRSNVTLSNLGDVRLACSQAFLAQLPAEQAAKIKADMEKQAAGETPLAPSPVPSI